MRAPKWVYPTLVLYQSPSQYSLGVLANTSPDGGFVKSRAHDHFSPGAGPKRSDLDPASGILKWAKTAYN